MQEHLQKAAYQAQEPTDTRRDAAATRPCPIDRAPDDDPKGPEPH